MAVTFRLMTANLLHQRSDRADFARFLAYHDPDVVVTQELGSDAADVLASAYDFHRLRPSLDFTGRGIATRFPAEFGDIDMPGRQGTSAIVDVSGVRVWLAGIHLLNPVVFPWWATARQRRLQLAGLLEWMEYAGEPRLVAGDFNASPRWPAYKRMASQSVDLVADWATERGVGPERTWAWRPGWPRLLRIDHVFGTGLKATNVQVGTIAGTDHNPVIADLSIG